MRSKGRAGDLVLEADLAAEAAVLQLLQERTPEVAVLAEESGHQPGQNSELQWCVDPLDGTTNYAHGFPFFACSIGLCAMASRCWEPSPLRPNQRHSGGLGLGAWCNEEPLHVSSCQALADSLLVTGFAYDRRERIDNNYSEFCYFSHRTHGVRRGGAAALDLALWPPAGWMATGNGGCSRGIWQPELPWLKRLAAWSVTRRQPCGALHGPGGGHQCRSAGPTAAGPGRVPTAATSDLQR